MHLLLETWTLMVLYKIKLRSLYFSNWKPDFGLWMLSLLFRVSSVKQKRFVSLHFSAAVKYRSSKESSRHYVVLRRETFKSILLFRSFCSFQLCLRYNWSLMLKWCQSCETMCTSRARHQTEAQGWTTFVTAKKWTIFYLKTGKNWWIVWFLTSIHGSNKSLIDDF